jgi:hypothetical protein
MKSIGILSILVTFLLSFGYSELQSNKDKDDITSSRRKLDKATIPYPTPVHRSLVFTPTSVPVRFPIPVGSCNVCDTFKPRNLTLQYTIPSKTSKIQKSFATCVKSNYPTSGTLSFHNKTSIPFQQGTIFILGGKISNRAVFTISKWGSCFIDTSCYTPLVVGDQIGPFRVLAGNDCTGRI